MTGVGLDRPGRPGVLTGVDLGLVAGETTVVEGRSGSGKSSLLSIAAGLLAPTSGTVHVMGEPMVAGTGGAAALRHRHVGLVFQRLHLLAELTALENVELPLRLARMGRHEARERAQALLSRFELAEAAARRPPQLSGGEAQRVAIARALAPQPGLLLVDEPTGNLDAVNAAAVAQALQQAAREGAAVLVATHDPVLHRIGRLLRMRDGRLEETG